MRIQSRWPVYVLVFAGWLAVPMLDGQDRRPRRLRSTQIQPRKLKPSDAGTRVREVPAIPETKAPGTPRDDDGARRLRLDRQRPVDPRLIRIERRGIDDSGLFPGEVHRAENADDINALSGNLSPGDQLVLVGTNWTDARFTFSGRGTETAPILIRPESPDPVVFTGNSQVAFAGGHLIIMDLTFRNVPVTRTGTVIFRLGNGEKSPANDCIANRIRIENCNSPDPADWPRVRLWYMTVRGRNNTVANSTFADLRNFGQMLAAQELPPDGLQRLHILNNRFTNRPYLDKQNGYEIIQIGWSGEKACPAGTLIQGNTFENCDGENETLTLKASDIVVRDNTFSGCQGVLCLRSANRVLVQGNVFDGKNRPNTGGVRLQGSGHVVIDNWFHSLRKPQNRYAWTVSLMAASAENYGDNGDVGGYGRAKNILIARNRFDGNDTRIAAGIYPRPDYPLLPKDIQVRDNVFTVAETVKSAFDYVAPDPTGMLPQDLHESGNRFVVSADGK